MNFKRKNPGNQSIRRQLTFYMGLFVVLPLCLALMLLNFYLQKVTTENKINNETDLLSQIRDNTDQMIEVTNYATSMLMTNKNTLKNLRILEQDGDSYEIYQAKRELSNDISDVESSVLNAVGGKVAILTKKGYMIGSYTLSRTETNYEKEQWYQEILENGRKITCSTDIGTIFQEMTIYDNVQKYFYMGREILDYSGKNLGIMLIRLSEKKIWGKLAASMVTEEGGALYILDRSNDILMAYNEKYQKQLKELKEQEIVKEISDNEITTGNLKDDFYYMEAKCFGVPVEAEIGELLRLDEAGVQMENKNVANPEQVRQFLDLCQPDSLAIGIGNAHGYYKGEPDIKLEVLEEVRKFTDIPFVLHGCTGMREDIIKEAIKLGVAKINFGTEIRYKYVEHYEEALKTNHQGHSWKLSQLANDALTEDIKKIIRLAGSEGKA